MRVLSLALLVAALVATATAYNVPLTKHILHESNPVRALLGGGIRAAVGNGTNFPVGGNIFPVGIYYTTIKLGSPYREYKVAIDSGSADTIVPQVGCNGCHANTSNEFDPTQSKTSKPVGCRDLFCPECKSNQCSFSNTYQTCDLKDPTAPCTISGPIWSDKFGIGSLSVDSIDFGAITYQTKNFEQFYVVDGVMGMIGKAGGWGETIPFQGLVDNGQVQQNTWALCMIDQGGVMTFGAPDTSLYHGEIDWIDETSNFYYGIGFRSIQVAGTTVAQPSQPDFIIDSGTNILLLEAGVFGGVRKGVEAQCSSVNLKGVCDSSQKSIFDGACYTYTPEDIAKFPNITLQVGTNSALTISGKDYILYHPSKQLYCLGISNTGSTFNIIGDSVMQNYYVIFDRDQRRLGWAPVNRDACLKTATRG